MKSSTRSQPIRQMLIRLSAHLDAPRWSSRVLEEMFEAALQPPGATVGDVVQALFTVLSGCKGLSDMQASFIRDVAIHVVGKHRRAYLVEDFSWLVTALTEAGGETAPAQAYLAAYVLPVALSPRCRDSILLALHSTPFEAEVKRELEG